MSFRFEIPEGSPLFASHFPGRPILPGIAHLAFVVRALSEQAGREVFLTEVKSLKFRRPVEPGETIEVALGELAEDGSVRFEIAGVSQGTVRIGERTPPAVALLLPPPFEEGRFPAPETLIPHGLPARLVRSIIRVSPEAVTCRAEISAAHPLAEAGLAPMFLGLEAGAQAAAVLEALGRSGPGGPRIGYLVGIRNARFLGPHLETERPFHVTVRPAGSAPPLSVYEVSLKVDGEERLTGTISTYLA